ncbi:MULTISPECIES: glycosyltransferase family 2 protein [Clostridium]|uniref:glycosyltransferase family 2 protein n=1 Tax=Clostridium TaxID=1485 RepID=UPI0006D7B1D9|nr:glycosyltransferase family 2 protein [Clostridium massiliamazoniense]
MTKISVVIAAYNIERYIDRCVDSVVNQSYKELEIIVVNDGSTDSTLEKLKKRAVEDNRIIIVDKENQGVIEARKSGYIKATGEYILFLDGDDWIDLDAIRKLKDKIEENDSDIVCFEYYEIFDNGKKIEGIKSKEFNILQGKEFLKYVLIGDILPTMCGKFFRVGFFKDNNIEFPSNISYAEDLAFVASLGCNNPKVQYLNESLYMYYQRDESITKKISPKLLEISEAMKFIKKKLEEKGIYNEFKNEFEYTVYLHCLVGKKNIIYDKNNSYGKEMFNRWKSFNIDIRKNSYIREQMKEASFIGRYLTILSAKFYFIGNILN